jgi:replicative DNA helicase
MSSVRSFIRKHNLSVLVIDHFSLIGYDGENKRGQNYERKEEITRGIQKILKELNVAGVILVQLGRDSQNRRPRLSDLSDTKALEQDANNVLMIWNPIHGDKERRVLCCEKGRDGGTGDYYMNFEGDTAKTHSMDAQPQEEYYAEIATGANHSQR